MWTADETCDPGDGTCAIDVVINEGVGSDTAKKTDLTNAIATLLHRCVTVAFPNSGGVIGGIGGLPAGHVQQCEGNQFYAFPSIHFGHLLIRIGINRPIW